MQTMKGVSTFTQTSIQYFVEKSAAIDLSKLHFVPEPWLASVVTGPDWGASLNDDRATVVQLAKHLQPCGIVKPWMELPT